MIKTDVYLEVGFKETDIVSAVESHLGIDRSEFRFAKILRSHLDLTDKSNIRYKLTVAIEASPEREAGLLKMRKKVLLAENLEYTPCRVHLKTRPVIIGAGPSGLFCALTLAEAGAEPILIERGESVDVRMTDVADFFKSGALKTESNIQFGEGGAGTFSDGKLKVGSYDKYKMKVLTEFVSAGAEPDILHSSSAHLGTDKLPSIIKKIREKIINLGGDVRFSSRLIGIDIKNGSVKCAKIFSHDEEYDIPTDHLILATGHSAADVFELLDSLGIKMQPKGFGVGMRIEHGREYINEIQYGKDYSSELPTASYHLVTHLKNGRSVYSFCMCPGGTVVAAANEADGIVTNGMSEYKRNGENSNSTILVSVTPNDFPDASPLAGIAYQRAIEREAYKKAGGTYRAPAIRLDSFMNGTEFGNFTSVLPTYPLGVVTMRPEEYLPKYITDSIKSAIPDFNAWMRGFYHPDAVFTGPETRTTSPIRVLRTESYEALGIKGLYPIGEGAGYAGGIVSSAVDGIRAADAIISHTVL